MCRPYVSFPRFLVMPVARFLLNTIPLSKSIFRETNHRTCEGSGGIMGAGRGRGLRPWSAPSPRAGRPSPPRTLTGAEGDAENGLDSRTWSAPFPIKPPSSTLQARPLGASPDLPSGVASNLPAWASSPRPPGRWRVRELPRPRTWPAGLSLSHRPAPVLLPVGIPVSPAVTSHGHGNRLVCIL